MEFFKNLRIRIGLSMLSAKTAKSTRIINYSNFSHIKSIGIVWDASNPDDFAVLSRFHQKMSEQEKEVTIFAYYPGKTLPDQYIAVKFLTCLKYKEVDFFYRPVIPDAQTFINTSYDLLIDINFSKHFPLTYITSLSRAMLKVGIADLNPEVSPFDLMISLKNPVSIESYIEQVVYYLEMINSQQAKKAV